MKFRTLNPAVRTQKAGRRSDGGTVTTVLLLGMAWCSGVLGADLTPLVQERTAIERVYYNRRLGTKPPFEQASPPSLIEGLVKQDLRKEAALQKAYGVKFTPAKLDAEVQRINTSTRAPEMLAEIKAALGNDPERFAEAFAKPLLVERLLRDKFDNDDTLHAARRRSCEQARNELLAARRSGASPVELLAQFKEVHSNAVSETTWQLGARPEETNAPAVDELEIKKRFGPNAQVLSAAQTGDGKDQKFYFEDMPGELQNVLRIQLREAGDVSAVIETTGGFLLYVAKERTDSVLSVASLSLPKRSYEQWLAEQKENQP